MRHQFGSAEFHGFAIVQYAIHMRARTARRSALLFRDIGIHHHQLRPSLFLDHAGGGVMIAMRVADEDNFGVAVLEAELLDAFLNQRYILLEVGIDQDVALRRVDQVDG